MQRTIGKGFLVSLQHKQLYVFVLIDEVVSFVFILQFP